MELAPSVATSVDPCAAEQPGKGGGGTKVVLILAFAVFFLLGGVTNINDLLVGKFKPMFHLTHAEANLVQKTEEHTSELQSLMRISYAVFCLKKKKKQQRQQEKT